ncbi:hypothetical protein [Phytohabitans houttuyneae]|uniref:PPE family domain-containing protein n=1 Tax=Phytohabitans houttuyneae TaxID=1076126 RepID=A0A6V8KDS9_9ACTN|nr:hypothetical protein [Phytohabitans houttuyneae]GFJ80581.1 hypothetical protein Phou_047610 [Phytohabitans houttuyneae]
MAWEKSGVPGTATRTSWFDRDVPAMWRTLENQQSDDHWRLVAGWRKAADLTAIHLRRLEHYRTNLVEAWPPDRNAAAAAYVSRLDFLIQNVRTTHDVAAANYSTLAATVGALASARNDLKPLYDEYMTKAKALTAYRELAAFNAAAEGSTVIGAAPVRPDDLERLNNRARAIMYTLSHTLVEAEAAIRQPPTYEPTVHWDQGRANTYGDSGRPSPTTSATRPPSPEHPAVDSTRSDPNAGSTPASAIPGTGGPLDRVISPRGKQSLTARDGEIGRGRHPREATDGSGGSLIHQARGTAISGGIIGASPELEDRHAPRAPLRVNPVGGIIGGQHVREPANHPSSMISPVLGSTAASQGLRKDRSEAQRTRETNWEVPNGVPPVIEPRKVVKYDPGPAIGLER